MTSLREAVEFAIKTLAADFGGWWTSAPASDPLGQVRNRLEDALVDDRGPDLLRLERDTALRFLTDEQAKSAALEERLSALVCELAILRNLERAVFAGNALACSPKVPPILDEYHRWHIEREGKVTASPAHGPREVRGAR